MRALFLFFISFTAMASDSIGWQKVPAGSPLYQIYRAKDEVAIFTPDDSNTSEMPSAHLQIVPAAANVAFKQQSKQLATEILSELQVNLRARTTYQLVHDSFQAGPHHDLPGMVFQTQSERMRAAITTCIAVVRKQNKMHVIFMSSYKEAFPPISTDEGNKASYDKYECSKRLVELARMNLIYQ